MPNDSAPVSTGAAPAQAQPADTSNSPGTPDSSKASNAQSSQPAQPKSWKSKVDGREVTWSDENELVKDASLGKAAFQRMREAAEAKKAADSFMEKFRKDPMAALEDPALNISDEQRRELIEKYYQKKYLETDELSPQQRKIRELEEKLKAKEEAERLAEEGKKAEAQKALETKWRDTYQQQIIDAIEKGGFPKTPRTAARVAFYMAQAAESGFDAPLDMIVAQVGKDYEAELQSILAEEVPIEAILKVVPPGFLKRLRKYDLEQYKAKLKGNTTPVTPPSESSQAPKERPKERMTYAEVLKKFGS